MYLVTALAKANHTLTRPENGCGLRRVEAVHRPGDAPPLGPRRRFQMPPPSRDSTRHSECDDGGVGGAAAAATEPA